MALPSLTGQTVVVQTRASDDPWLTWGNLWVIPVTWIALNVLVVALLVWRGRNRKP